MNVHEETARELAKRIGLSERLDGDIHEAVEIIAEVLREAYLAGQEEARKSQQGQS